MRAMAVMAYEEPLREIAMPEPEVLLVSPSGEYRLPSPRLVLGEIEIVGRAVLDVAGETDRVGS